MTVILKLLCSLTLLPFIFACYRAFQWGFWESAAYGFLGIVASYAVWFFVVRCAARQARSTQRCASGLTTENSNNDHRRVSIYESF